MANIRAAMDSLDGIIALANNSQNVGARDIRNAMQIGVPKAEKMAQGFLVKSYRRSGLKVRTGQLIGMLRRSTLSIIDATTSRVALVIAMPAGMKPKDYAKAGSVNYGSVRHSKTSLLNAQNSKGNKLIGERQRRNLKGVAGSIKSSDHFTQASRDIGVRGVGTTANGSKILDTTVGQATVTKAWNYFHLTDQQIDKIKEVIFQDAWAHLMTKITGKKAIRRAA